MDNYSARPAGLPITTINHPLDTLDNTMYGGISRMKFETNWAGNWNWNT